MCFKRIASTTILTFPYRNCPGGSVSEKFSSITIPGELRM